MKPPPPAALIAATALCGFIGLSALAGAAAALLNSPTAWFLFAFEGIILLSAILGVFVGRGRFAEGPALALACIAGCVAIGSYLGYMGSGRVILGASMKPFLGARAASAAGLAVVAAWIVLSRRLRIALPRLIKGLLVGLPIPVIVWVLWAMRARVSAAPDLLRAGGAVVLFVVVTALLSASIHLILRAFESGRTDDDAGPIQTSAPRPACSPP